MHLLEVVSTTSRVKSTKERNQKERKKRTNARNDPNPRILPLTQAANNQAQAQVQRAVLSHQSFSKEIVHTVTTVNT